MQQAKATKTLVFQFDHVNPRIHVSIGLVPPPRTPVAHVEVQVEIPYEKTKILLVTVTPTNQQLYHFDLL